MYIRSYQQRGRLSHYQNLTSLSAFGSILKIFWEPTSVSVKVILLVWHDKTLRTMATSVLAKRWTLTLLKIQQAFRRSVPFLKDFWGTGVRWYESRILGWTQWVNIYIPIQSLELLGFVHVWTYQRRDGLSHYQNLTSLSAFGSILKDFRELTSVSVKVILLVWHDKTLHTMATSVLAKRWTLTLLKIRQAFRRSVPCLKDFGEPMSVNVKVVLLV